jgi:hypothetical protein
MKLLLTSVFFTLAIAATNAHNFAVVFSNPNYTPGECHEEFAALKASVWPDYEDDLTINRMLRGDRNLGDLCPSWYCEDPIYFVACTCNKRRRDLKEVSGEVAGGPEDISGGVEFSGGIEHSSDERKLNHNTGSYGNILVGQGEETAQAVYDYADGMNSGVCKDMAKAMTYKVIDTYQ